jgi:hypothetical protein
MRHQHIGISAPPLAVHPQLEIEFCECTAFRLKGCERWVEEEGFTREQN